MEMGNAFGSLERSPRKEICWIEPYKVTIFKGQKWLNTADFIWFNPVQSNLINSD